MDFSKMVLVAILIGLPASYLLAKEWLNGFAYKIDLTYGYFLGATILTFLIRSEEHTSELQSLTNLVCRLLLEKKKKEKKRKKKKKQKTKTNTKKTASRTYTNRKSEQEHTKQQK